MSRNAKRFLMVSLALGLLPAGLAGAGKPPSPPPTCPDCTIVYSLRSPNTGADLMLMKEDGTQKTLLLAGAKNLRHTGPAWSPGGDWIAFMSNRDGGYGIWVIKPDGTGVKKVAQACSSSASRLSWGPVNPAYPTLRWLAFTDTCGSVGDSQNLWAVEFSTLNPDLETPICLTCDLNADNSMFWSYVAWSPSGAHLAANMSPVDLWGPKTYILKVVFDGAGLPSLVQDSSWPWLVQPPAGQDEMHMPAWANWSDSLAVKAIPGNDLWRLDLDLSGQTAQYMDLTEGSGFSIFNPRWSPDDNRFICEAAIPGLPAKSAIRVISFGPTTFTSIAPGGLHPDWKR